MNVQEVIDVIIRDCGVDLRSGTTCDVLVSGRPDMEVKGIATTFMATVDVIRKAATCGANLIITHEPTFFTGTDETDWLQDDPVYLAKKRLIEEYGIAIWRFHDHMHLAKPDRIYRGLNKELNWEQYYRPEGGFAHVYHIKETTLADLAVFFKSKLQMNVIRTIGRPDMICKKIGILVGGGSLGLGREQMPMEFMRQYDLDTIICGEITEWTLCAYINDAQMLNMDKAMIILGHERSEEWGMKEMAEWLRPLVNGIPVTFIDSEEPFRYL